MLGRGPDGEDEMVGIAFGDLAGLDPGADDLSLFVHQRFQGPFQLVLDARRPLQHLIGEETAFTREVARHFQLAANIAADLRFRIALRIELAQGIEPAVEHALDQRPMHGLLGAEIIEQIGLRHARHLGDLVDRAAAESMGGEDIQRGFEDQLLLLFLDACAALRFRCPR